MADETTTTAGRSTPVLATIPPPRIRSKPLPFVPVVVKNPTLNAGVNPHRYTVPSAEENINPRFELFLLGDGEKKVSETPDTRIPSSSLFTFNKEDHTLGNMLRSRLLQSNHVTFAGYKVPHPLFSTFELRVQTDGEVTPRAALVQACRDLVNDLGVLGREFTKEWELRKMVGEGANGANGDKQ
ncbi:MAG: DNA-directed RNA polymerase II core subunit [Pleopsidium flavum]|nr:MAG: DNA-directed RNA polymerase II core subunit [Pleopsidium flavum]KAI9880088.1 MAG: DNA-directed RNA polymerase II core subunit [Pleopsidium flavum]